MAWLRIDDRVRTHPKIAMAGPAAAWLWFCGICYCREHLTDGFIPRAVVASLAMNLTQPIRHAERLVSVRLWLVVDGGYQVHDFLDWNPSRAEVEASRAQEASRKRSERVRDVSGRTNDGVREMSSYVRAGGAGLGSLSGSGVGDLSEEESARETRELAPVWSSRGKSPGLMADHHLRCYRSPACARGVCVPGWLATEWRQQYGDDTAMADVEIGSVITTALAALPPSGPIGDEPKVFWRAVWKAAHGSQAPASGVSRSKGQLTLDAARRFVLSRMQATGAAS